MKLISGSANPALAKAIATHIPDPKRPDKMMSLTPVTIQRFADSEIFVQICDNVRGEDIFIIQPTCFPANDNLMELLILVDALRRGFARSIIAVMPYYGYSRQDRKNKPRTPISARLVANMLETAGVNRVLTMDLHAGQIQGFFNIPVDNIYARQLIAQDIQKQFVQRDNILVIAPDMGGVPRARALANQIDTPLAIIDKRRLEPGKSEVMNIIGEVAGKDCILVDDMVDTAETLCNAANALLDKGAHSVHAYATHGVLSRDALTKIAASRLSEMVVTNTIPVREALDDVAGEHKVRYIDVASFLATAIACIRDNRSVSSLFT
ncbi:MAG: ribose-phosphate pyrophosphokinase [Alphaproteobacteria bacterium]|nr:ribose-phosphate pyrophosphokinase [Alphaproteobacteria bacterium]